MTWRTGAGPGGLTRKRPGHNVNTYRLTQNKVLSRETITASGAILIKRGEITCPRIFSKRCVQLQGFAPTESE